MNYDIAKGLEFGVPNTVIDPAVAAGQSGQQIAAVQMSCR
jgi:hypothetical protein